MKTADVLPLYVEYATYLPALLVLEAATDRSGWDAESWEIYGEQVAEVANERALSGSPTASSDARRIVDFLARDRALRSFAAIAPAHADACADLSVPIFAVLGNHDFHAGRVDDVRSILEQANLRVLDRSWQTCTVAGLELGVVGAKGFIGGFPGSALPDFGEETLRAAYSETTLEADAIGRGLQEIVHWRLRVSTRKGSPPRCRRWDRKERVLPGSAGFYQVLQGSFRVLQGSFYCARRSVRLTDGAAPSPTVTFVALSCSVFRKSGSSHAPACA